MPCLNQLLKCWQWPEETGRVSYQGIFCGFPIMKLKWCQMRLKAVIWIDVPGNWQQHYVFWPPTTLPSYVLRGGEVEQTLTTALLRHPKFP